MYALSKCNGVERNVVPHVSHRATQPEGQAQPEGELEKLAKQDRRTLSAYVEKQLEDHVTEQERRRAKRSTIIRTTAHSSP